MTIKIADIISIKAILDDFVNMSLPIRVSYKLSKLKLSIDNEHELYFSKLIEVVNKYAELDENGQPKLTEDKTGVQIKSKCLNECNNEINELQSIEIEIPSIKFTLDELSSLNLSVAQITKLLPFIEE